MGLSKQKGLILYSWTMTCCLLVCLSGADAAQVSKVEEAEPIRAVLGHNVTIPCIIQYKGSEELDLNTVSVRWTKSINGTGKSVYRYGDLQHHPIRNGSHIEDRDLRKGNASLCLMHVQLSDEGTYKCLIIVTPNKLEVFTDLQVLAKPTCAVSDSNIKIIRGNERSVSCYISHFYPKSVEVHWVRYRKGSSDRIMMDRDVCNMAPVENEDGTFNVTTVLSLRPQKGYEDGDMYTCIVSHRSLDTGDLSLNVTLTLQEAQNYEMVTGILIPLLLLLAITAASVLYVHCYKEAPEVYNITKSELIHMKRTRLISYISQFKPKEIDLHLYVKKAGEKTERAIVTWNSITSERSQVTGDNLPLQENGSDNVPMDVVMTGEMSHRRLGAFFVFHSCKCCIDMTPSLDYDGAKLFLDVRHRSLRFPIRKELRLEVKEGTASGISRKDVGIQVLLDEEVPGLSAHPGQQGDQVQSNQAGDSVAVSFRECSPSIIR